ncbi:MAG TPA: LysR family transcriptional regulator [Candidatus Acidoferrales bacterium]|nr:LysR family transcriptional regulator [Candidatus Acidoferrales bacterium]
MGGIISSSAPAVPNLRYLRAFREIVRCGSVSAAARAIHLTQPAVTQIVAHLELSFATHLFERTSAGMLPTEAARLLLARVDRALAQLTDGLSEATRARDRDGGPARADVLRAITVAQLVSLVAVVEAGSFGGAARWTGLARPSLHRAARSLENVIGIPLFEATSFGVRPTREAERLARRVQLAFAEIAQARAEIAALGGGSIGRTVIGAMPLARSLLVPRAVLEFSNTHPQHTISILDGPYENLLAALRKGFADMLIGALREPLPGPDIVQEHLFDDPLAVVVRAHHPLARRPPPSIGELSSFRWVAPRPGTPLSQQFTELFTTAGIEVPPQQIECNSLAAARALLIGSDRVMLLSEHQIQQELASGLLVALPHPGGCVARRIGLTMRRDWRATPVQAVLLDILRQTARHLARELATVRHPSAGTLGVKSASVEQRTG